MEDNTKLIETLVERAAEYGKTSYELAKLKALDKTSEVVSSVVPGIIVFVFVASFVLFLSFGLAFWLGDILGSVAYGFFAVAALYGVKAIVIYFFMPKLKKRICNCIIKQVLK
jgi:fatty acid desaturase